MRPLLLLPLQHRKEMRSLLLQLLLPLLMLHIVSARVLDEVGQSPAAQGPVCVRAGKSEGSPVL
jgi:hypothetical protein